MGHEKEIVITAYGHDNVIEKIAVSFFDKYNDSWRGNNATNAQTYCTMLNGLDISDGSWVFAKVVPENAPVNLNNFMPDSLFNLILKIPDRSLQKVFREIDFQQLALPLSGCSEAVLEKVFRNMSSNASQLLKEEIGRMEPAKKKRITESQEKIISIIEHLEVTGEITYD